jgi:hypothetical protein
MTLPSIGMAISSPFFRAVCANSQQPMRVSRATTSMTLRITRIVFSLGTR